MNCKQGDLAFIIKAIITANIGKVVTVKEYIGKFEANDVIDHKSLHLQVPISDHYWWVEASSPLETHVGQTTRAYIADTWLKPIPPLPEEDTIDTNNTIDEGVEA